MKGRVAFGCCALALVILAALRIAGSSPAKPIPTIPETTPNFTVPTEITQPTEQETLPEAVLSFSPDSLSAVKIRNSSDYQPEWGTLLTTPLTWDLQGDKPTVLILHTHGTESYRGEYKQWVPWRTTDEDHNMVRIGREVARVLELGGIRVIHECTLFDYPHYNSAYASARKSIQAWLEEYPSIRLVLDLHRDASDDPQKPLTTHGTVAGQPASQLMFVVGTDGSGLHHPKWSENLALALKMTVLLEQADPGITRGVSLRQQRFNMDLSPGSLLVEVGAAGDTQEQALLAANALARAVLLLAKGSN